MALLNIDPSYFSYVKSLNETAYKRDFPRERSRSWLDHLLLTLYQEAGMQGAEVDALGWRTDGKKPVGKSYLAGIRVISRTGNILNVSFAAFDPTTKKILAASNDLVTQANTKNPSRVRVLDYKVTPAAFKKMQQLTGGKVKRTQPETPVFKTDDSVYGLAVSPDSKLVGSVSVDKSMRLWDAATGAQLCKVYTAYNWIDLITFSPVGGVVACGYGPIKLYSTNTGKLLQKLNGFKNDVAGITFSSDGRYIAAFTNSHPRSSLMVWEVNSGKVLWKILMSGRKQIPWLDRIECSKSRNVIIAINCDNLFAIDFKTGKILFQKKIDKGARHGIPMKTLDKYVISTDVHWEKVVVYDDTTFKLLKSVKMKDYVGKLDASNNGKIAVLEGEDDKIVVLNIKDLSVVKTFNNPFEDKIKTIAIAPNGKFVVACSETYIKRIDL